MDYERTFLPEDQVGWNHSVFDNIKRIMHEEVSFISESVQVESGFECKKCKSTKTYTYQQQTRSADEGFTTFTICFHCDRQMIE